MGLKDWQDLSEPEPRINRIKKGLVGMRTDEQGIRNDEGGRKEKIFNDLMTNDSMTNVTYYAMGRVFRNYIKQNKR